MGRVVPYVWPVHTFSEVVFMHLRCQFSPIHVWHQVSYITRELNIALEFNLVN